MNTDNLVKNPMHYAKAVIANPFTMALVLFAALYIAADRNVVVEVATTGATVVKLIHAFIACVSLMVSVKIAMFAHVLFKHGDPGHVDDNPIASAQIRVGIYVAFALVYAAILG